MGQNVGQALSLRNKTIKNVGSTEIRNKTKVSYGVGAGKRCFVTGQSQATAAALLVALWETMSRS